MNLATKRIALVPSAKIVRLFLYQDDQMHEYAAVYTNDTGRILSCGHELCFGESIYHLPLGCADWLSGM